MSGETVDPGREADRPTALRLIWSNPCPPAPRRPIDLAAAIERHLSGTDGLTDEQFLHVYSRRDLGSRPAWAQAALVV
jgi:hypothetical protein